MLLKFHKHTITICMTYALTMLSVASYAEEVSTAPFPLLPDDIARIGLLQVGKNEVNIPLPSIYPLTASSNKSGPDHSWHQVTFIPPEVYMPAWDEMISLLILPSNLPARPTPNSSALQIIEGGVNRECVEKVSVEKSTPPKFTIDQAEVEAITIKCKSVYKKTDLPYVGYHVAIRNGDYIYILSRTATERTHGSFSTLPKGWPDTWAESFKNFAICPLNEACSLNVTKKQK